MTILDAYAVIAYLRNKPAAEQVSGLLAMEEANLTAVGLGAVFDQMVRVAWVDEEELALDLGELGLLDATEVNAVLGTAAGRLRGRYYHRTRCPASMDDCLAAETARAFGRPLATSDPHLLGICHAERIGIVPLADSGGSVWTPSQ